MTYTDKPVQTIAETLAAYASSLNYEDIPADVVHQAKRIIVDTIGCAFGGFDSEPATIARDMAALVSSIQPATLLCSGQKTSMELAVFANDVMVRYLDYNDGYVSKGGGHPSDSIAALLSAAEVSGAGGREFITATVLVYEVFCRICDAWDNKPCGYDHVTMGGIASVVGAARLLGLTQAQTVEAINIMVAGNIALNQIRVGNVSKWKGCAYANASRNAIFTAQLAARGMTGPSPIFEGRNGFFAVVSRAPFELAPFGGSPHEAYAGNLVNEKFVASSPSPPTPFPQGEGRVVLPAEAGRFEGRAQPFRIMQCHLKQFPLGNFSQTVVTAILEARALVSDVSDIAEVQIRVSPKAMNVMADSPEKWSPRNRETADHSIPYTAAVALMYGTVDQSYFDERYFLHDKQLLGLVSRIKCAALVETASSGPEISLWNLCEIDLVLSSGERKSVKAEYHRGHWRNPMTNVEIEKKFRSLAAGKLPAESINALLERLWNLEGMNDIGTLIGMTEIPAARYSATIRD